jgi:hypothetical protein
MKWLIKTQNYLEHIIRCNKFILYCYYIMPKKSQQNKTQKRITKKHLKKGGWKMSKRRSSKSKSK